MSYLIASGPCVACKRTFAFNAERVPAIVVAGQRAPICSRCVEQANKARAAQGLDPIIPLQGAYSAEETP